MSGNETKHMIAPYIERAGAPMFLSSLFKSPRRNFYNSKTLELDIIRSDEKVSPIVTHVSSGYVINSADIYTNKEMVAPVIKEAGTVNQYDMLDRNFGDNPFANRDLIAMVNNKLLRLSDVMIQKVRRNIELQASQALQTGTITLKNEAGIDAYNIDFDPKTTHFPTVGTTWADHTTSTPFADIEALCEVIRNDGLEDCTDLLMGIDAYNNMIQNDDIKERLDNRRINEGKIGPLTSSGTKGSQFRGTIDVGLYRLNITTYGGRFTNSAGNKELFLNKDKVVVMAESGRRDLTFGAIPPALRPAEALGRLRRALPPRISTTSGGMDLTPHVWFDERGETMFFGLGTRPLIIPTAIDTFGCLLTIP